MRRLTVVIDGGSASDAEELDALTGQLRRQLLELDVDTVEPARTEDVPAGAKPMDVVSIGALVVTLGPAALKAVVSLVERWLEHRPVRSVKLTLGDDTLEITDVDDEDQDELIDAFLARHETDE